MPKRQEKHLKKMKSDFCKRLDAKYRKGAAEHGNDLLAMDTWALLVNALAEVIDLAVYLQTALAKEEKK